MTRAPLSLRARALGWLAQREHSRLELRRKLLRAAAQAAAREALAASGPAEPDDDAGVQAQAAVDALLDELTASGYLDESRFIESRVHARAGRLGTQRIRQELAQHGLSLDPEQNAQLKASELPRATAVWRKRFGGEPPQDAAAWAKQSRFLAARGFSPDVIRQLLREGPAELGD